MFISLFFSLALAALPHNILIDGDFSDWSNVPSYFDPQDDINGTVVDCGNPTCVPDCHDSLNNAAYDYIPPHVYNQAVDILEYKFTHDATHMYTFIRAASRICERSRCYVITTIDIDQNDTTGYNLFEGGYFPSTPGYDINYEVEFLGGSVNQGMVLNHGANNKSQYNLIYWEQIEGIMNVAPGYYSVYSSWVTWDKGAMTQDEKNRCASMTNPLNNSYPCGPYTLPSGEDICFTYDKAPGPFTGQVKWALDPTGTMIEIGAPFSAFMVNSEGKPNVYPGAVLDISISLEADGTMSVPQGDWATDTAAPILRYSLDLPTACASSSEAFRQTKGGAALLFLGGMATGAVLLSVVMYFFKKKGDENESLLM